MTSTYHLRHIYCSLTLILLWATCCITSCSDSTGQDAMIRAEALMEEHPDSALFILKTIDKSRLGSKSERARYALLMSMALDKNYIDTTTFDVLQPAIDYYLENGSPDEKLRTYYYQGCIFQNKGDRDKALNSFVKGLDNRAGCTDSLCMARAFVAQGLLYMEFYDFRSYADSYLKAADIYSKKDRKDLEFDCLLNALNGSIILKDRHRADSLMELCRRFEPLEDSQRRRLQGYRLSHALVFGSLDELKDFIGTHSNDTPYDINGYLNLAYAYNKTKDNEKALSLLKEIDGSGASYDTLKYQSILVDALEDSGDYENAFSVYRNLTNRLDAINSFKFEQKAKSIEEKHQIELQARDDLRRKNNVIWGCVAGIAFLAMGIGILILSLRSNRVKKIASEERAENLDHRVSELEREAENLKEALQSQTELPEAVKTAVGQRLEMLNALLAGEIANNDNYRKPYDEWIKALMADKKNFMASNRLAFQASHQRLIEYLESHGLTDEEIEYACLYALGLRGKEVGTYLNKASHIHMSSAIRKKLGIDKHETNIGIYIRRKMNEL